jgi:hypothetical protein
MGWMDSRWFVPGLLLILVVIPAAIAAGPSVVRSLTKDDRTFSLCPDDRNTDQVVSGSRMAEEGAAYRGPGPHPLIVDGPTQAHGSLPKSWVPPRASNGAYQIDNLQLVVCEYEYAVGAKADLGTCSFRPVNGGPVYRYTQQSATYDYKVYEATTGTMLTRFTLEAVGGKCADYREVPAGAPRDSRFPGSPDYDVLQRRLQPLVNADLPD